ncbi:MAG: glutaminyl-peptide cyclotransferase [Gemmatimonadales bacterium]|nr:MAG: glutaminyl-peptide cyclotransferase [Gemmatimonadales bacterium]
MIKPHSPNSRRYPAPARGAASLVAALLVGACAPSVPQETVEILRILPHDPGAYTQGLVLYEGRFFESTGTYGGSSLREVDVETGEVLRLHLLPDDQFGEGLAQVGNQLVQITWQEGVAHVYDIESFEVTGTFTYEGNGWGLCFDGESLWMTTGGSMLVRRDPETFAVRDRVQVTLDDRPLFEVNELACVGDHIYGNVFRSDRIVRIDKRTGAVVAEIDATPLNPESGRPVGDPEAVLNGIAWDPDSDTFYLTGKRWPTMFQVRFVPR